MKTRGIVFFAATALSGLATTVLSASCANPIFTSQLFGAPAITSLAATPQKHPENADVCTAFNNKDSCCTNVTLDFIKEFSDAGQEVLDEAATAIQTNDYGTELVNAINARIDYVCTAAQLNLFPTLKSDCDNAKSTIDKYVKQLSDDTNTLLNAEVTCMKGLMKYYRGALCFACEADWDKYLVYNANGDVIGFDVNTNTCNSIVNNCAPVNTAVAKVAQTAASFVDELVKEFVGGSWTMSLDVNTLVYDLPDACGGTMGTPGDCNKFFCDTAAISGFGVPDQQNWGTGIVSGADDAVAIRRRKLQDMQRHLAEQLTSSVTVNTYTSSGYDAYSVGAKDLDDPFPGWAIAVIVVVAICIVGGIVAAVLVVKKRRGASRSASSSVSGPVARSVVTEAEVSNADYGSMQGDDEEPIKVKHLES